MSCAARGSVPTVRGRPGETCVTVATDASTLSSPPIASTRPSLVRARPGSWIGDGRPARSTTRRRLTCRLEWLAPPPRGAEAAGGGGLWGGRPPPPPGPPPPHAPGPPPGGGPPPRDGPPPPPPPPP